MALSTQRGLSPRVRGNLRHPAKPHVLPGSIPACAGEPEAAQEFLNCFRVYPRVCGGTCSRPRRTSFDQGLSPRVRGNPFAPGSCGRYERSIPACAGEPSLIPQMISEARVYPRVCGGTATILPSSARQNGLSPRVRGNPSGRFAPTAAQRSIPACAGEPEDDRQSGDDPEVYPRVCGGTHRKNQRKIKARGLSPRVRGNHPSSRHSFSSSRSIPACAGEPICRVRRRPRPGVYPRVCGGTGGDCPRRWAAMGLSPRVRGNRPRPRRSRDIHRSIPACAGEPVPLWRAEF